MIHQDVSNEIVVMPTLALGEENRDYAVAFASPLNTQGVEGIPTENRIRILRLIANMTGGTTLAESMHGAGSPQAQKVMYNRRGNMEYKMKLAKRLAGITESK